MEEYISKKTKKKFEPESDVGTVAWVQECGNYTKLLFNTLDDFQVRGNEIADWQEEYASDYLCFLIKRWIRNVGSKMWSDMTHFAVAGIMYPTSTYEDGEEIVMYNSNDAEALCIFTDSDPNRIAEMWQSEGGITKDVWQNAIRR